MSLALDLRVGKKTTSSIEDEFAKIGIFIVPRPWIGIAASTYKKLDKVTIKILKNKKHQKIPLKK